MWAILGILAAAATIFIIDAPDLLKRRLTKELWIFSFLLLLGTVLSILLSLNVVLPNPLDWLTVLYRPFNDLLEGALK
jgi:hypothetical protein